MIPTVLKAILPIVVDKTLTAVITNQNASPAVIAEKAEKLIAAAPEVQAALHAKPWWQSKTVLSGVGVVAVGIASLFGYAISAGDLESVLGHLNTILMSVLGLVAIYGRITAKQPLS